MICVPIDKALCAQWSFHAELVVLVHLLACGPMRPLQIRRLTLVGASVFFGVRGTTRGMLFEFLPRHYEVVPLNVSHLAEALHFTNLAHCASLTEIRRS